MGGESIQGSVHQPLSLPASDDRNVDYIPDGMGSVNARAIRAINVGAELIGDYGDDYVFEPHCACCWPVGGSCRWCEP